MASMKTCVVCNNKSALTSTTSTQWLRVGPVSFEGEIPAMQCTRCGETFVDGAVLQRFELLVAKHLADHGQRTPDAFRFMRKALDMRAADLAELIGIGVETISRYETGTREIDPVRFGVLATLVADRVAGRDEAQQRFRMAMAPVPSLPHKMALKVA